MIFAALLADDLSDVPLESWVALAIVLVGLIVGLFFVLRLVVRQVSAAKKEKERLKAIETYWSKNRDALHRALREVFDPKLVQKWNTYADLRSCMFDFSNPVCPLCGKAMTETFIVKSEGYGTVTYETGRRFRNDYGQTLIEMDSKRERDTSQDYGEKKCKCDGCGFTANDGKTGSRESLILAPKPENTHVWKQVDNADRRIALIRSYGGNKLIISLLEGSATVQDVTVGRVAHDDDSFKHNAPLNDDDLLDDNNLMDEEESDEDGE